MQDVRRGHAASQIAINTDVVRIKDVGNIHHRRDGNASLVYAAIHSYMRVAIDDAWHDELIRSINDLRICRRLQIFSNSRNLSILDEDVALLDRAMRGSQNRRIVDKQNGGAVCAALIAPPVIAKAKRVPPQSSFACASSLRTPKLRCSSPWLGPREVKRVSQHADVSLHSCAVECPGKMDILRISFDGNIHVEAELITA